jgi:head-tail adaptor
MNIGKLDRKIDIYTFTETMNAEGGFSISETLFKSMWAKVANSSPAGKEYTNDRKQGVDTLMFTVRYGYAVDLLDTMLLKYMDETYTILSIQEAVQYGRKVAFEIDAQIKR